MFSKRLIFYSVTYQTQRNKPRHAPCAENHRFVTIEERFDDDNLIAFSDMSVYRHKQRLVRARRYEYFR